MDIALIFTEHGDFDVDIRDRDLVGDESPITPITISLYTDRAAKPDDSLPSFMPGQKVDRRGWWGDLIRDDGRVSPIGSRLWLLSREKELRATVDRAQEYAVEALDWIRAEQGTYAIAASDGGRGRLLFEGAAKLSGARERTSKWTAFIDVTKPSKITPMGG
ncbi:MAG: phage GP46 family protein [Deltaproteobacteria bacterium]|jgi:phage gp46-like protein|nr:phage GP46 family protein [Deltaproteobacteria bacterium]